MRDSSACHNDDDDDDDDDEDEGHGGDEIPSYCSVGKAQLPVV